MIPTASAPSSFPNIIVVGNEKGGSGKSTVAIHIAVALMKSGESVGTIDLDSRQKSFTRYIENRRNWAERIGRDLGIPEHICLDGDVDVAEVDERHIRRKALTDAVALLSQSCNYILVDTPGHDTFMTRVAHSLAHTLVTPLNDSFVDFDVLASVDPETFLVKEISHYATMVEEVRSQRQLVGEVAFNWIVLRNRLSTFGASRNKRLVAAGLQELSQKLNFNLVDGLAERVIFREFYPRGLTALDDLNEKTLGVRPTLSHATARLEIENLLRAILIGDVAKSSDFSDQIWNAA